MGLAGLSFQEIHDANEAQELNLLDPDKGFADVRYHSDEGGQRFFIIRLNGTVVGYFSVVWPDSPEIYQFFICPNARRQGIGAEAGRALIQSLLAEHQSVSLSVVTESAYQFWQSSLGGLDVSEHGDTLRITRC